MKKYFFGITAAVVAVTLSAFTLGSGNHTKSDRPLTNLYWYLFDGTRITTPVGSGSMDKPSAENVTSCPDNQTAPICSYGYANQQTGLPKLPGTFDDQIKKAN